MELTRGESVTLTVCFTGLLLVLSAMGLVVVIVGEGELGRSLGNYLSGIAYVLIAVLFVLRTARPSSKRRSWVLFAAGLSLYGLGNLLWTFWIGELAHPPIPSICDALWLSLYPLSYAGILGFVRVEGGQRIPRGVWLDGVIAGLGCAAVGAAVVFGRVMAAVSGSSLATVTELTYPVLDLVLAGLVVAVLVLRGWRIDRSWGFLGAGFLLLAVGDCLYAVNVADGSKSPSALNNLVYVLAVSLLALAAWQPESRPRWAWSEVRSALLMPVAASVGALALLLYAQLKRLDPLTYVLAAGTLFALIVRMGITLTDLHTVMRERVAAERARAESEQQKRELQERLVRTQRLETAGALAAGVAHDFNNLLAVIVNLVGCVSDELPPDSDAAHDVQQIGRAADRAAALTARLLAFGQRRVGPTEMLDIAEVVAGTRAVLERQLDSDVELRCECPASPWPVEADPNDIEQILLNLVLNAGDAFTSGGRITVSIENIELLEPRASELDMRAGRYVRIAVTDDGCGIDENTLSRVWDPFFTTKPPGAGTGLGLPSVYGIARDAGGGVAITSTVGHGTRVEVYLRATAGGGERPAVDPEAPRTGATVKGAILLVDGDTVEREVVRAILEGDGYHVLVAEGAEQALVRLAAVERCDLLLTDALPPDGGRETLAGRAHELRPGLPVLLMSGYRDRFLAGDPTPLPGPVLTRPFQGDELLRQVGRLVSTGPLAFAARDAGPAPLPAQIPR